MVAVMRNLDSYRLGGLEECGSLGNGHLLAIDGQGYGLWTLLIGHIPRNPVITFRLEYGGAYPQAPTFSPVRIRVRYSSRNLLMED